jgi:hypothetical protein
MVLIFLQTAQNNGGAMLYYRLIPLDNSHKPMLYAYELDAVK